MTKDEKEMLEFVMGFIPEKERVNINLDRKDDWLLVHLNNIANTTRFLAKAIRNGEYNKT